MKRFLSLLLSLLICVSCVLAVTVSGAQFPADSGVTVNKAVLTCQSGQGTTAAELACLSESESFSLASSKGVPLDTDRFVATGNIITLDDGVYTVVVPGDLDRDGLVGGDECGILAPLLDGSAGLDSELTAAADANGDGVVNTADYLFIKHYDTVQYKLQSSVITCSVPYVEGRSEADAISVLEKAGLSPRVTYVYSDSEDDGKVVRQKVDAGTQVGSGTVVGIVIGKYAGADSRLNYDVMKGIWLSQFDMNEIYTSGGKQRSESSYRLKVDAICKKLAESGYNTTVIQVRPYADSFYPSQIYTPSEYVTGSYSTGFSYDPFEIFIEIAHSYELSVHAWINPMRCMTASDISSVSSKYLLGQWYRDSELRAKYLYYNKEVTDTNYYYLNPAYEEVRSMIIDGVEEICLNYRVDAVHMDDYFYPSESSGYYGDFDKAAYQELGNGKSLSRFRMDNVNTLVRGIYSKVKSINKNILFGISPAGTLSNCRGYLSADVDTWCANDGYVDYIAPQVYWGFDVNYAPSRFITCCNDWASLIKTDSVKLIIGMGLYRTVEPPTDEWIENKDVIKRQLEYLQNSFPYDSGFIMYTCSSLIDMSTAEYLSVNSAERGNFLPVLKKFTAK